MMIVLAMNSAQLGEKEYHNALMFAIDIPVEDKLNVLGNLTSQYVPVKKVISAILFMDVREKSVKLIPIVPTTSCVIRIYARLLVWSKIIVGITRFVHQKNTNTYVIVNLVLPETQREVVRR